MGASLAYHPDVAAYLHERVRALEAALATEVARKIQLTERLSTAEFRALELATILNEILDLADLRAKEVAQTKVDRLKAKAERFLVDCGMRRKA